jgi:hypothetical protein
LQRRQSSQLEHIELTNKIVGTDVAIACNVQLLSCVQHNDAHSVCTFDHARKNNVVLNVPVMALSVSDLSRARESLQRNPIITRPHVQVGYVQQCELCRNSSSQKIGFNEQSRERRQQAKLGVQCAFKLIAK